MVDEVVEGVRLTVFSNGATVAIGGGHDIIVRSQDAFLGRENGRCGLIANDRFKVGSNEETKSEFYRVGWIYVFYLTGVREIVWLLRCGRLYAAYNAYFCALDRVRRVDSSV